MSWTAPMTFTVGNVLHAADLNTDLRDNTLFLWDPPAAKSWRSTDIGITSGASFAAHQLDTVGWDSDGITNPSTGTFTIGTVGLYACSATAVFDIQAGQTGRRELRLNPGSGPGVFGHTIISAINGGTYDYMESHGHYRFNASWTLVAEVYQNSGGNVNLMGSITPVGYSLAVAWVGNAS